MQDLASRTAIVTGAAEGIGLAIAERLAACGAQVLLADVQDAKGEAAAARLGGRYRRCDVSSEADWAAVFEAADPVDILVNNAGVNPGAQDLATLSLEDWRRIHAINLDGVFLGCRFALNAMAERGGAIINISSAGAIRPNRAYPAYASSKAAVCTLTKSVALYCGERGLPIRCNAVLPGSVETPLVDRLRASGGDPDQARAQAAAKHPIGFVGAPQDIAAMTAFLASDEARFITGAQIAVDGGLSI